MNERRVRFDHPRMTDAELRIARDRLGVSGDWLAGRLGVDSRSYRRWEEGRYQVPPGVADQVAALLEEADKQVDADLTDLAGNSAPILYTYRDDRDYYEANPDGTYCSGWHRAIAGRVQEHIAHLVIAYYSRPPHLGAELTGQLLDVMNGVYIDAAARSAPKAFLTGEVEDCLDDVSASAAYPALLEAVRSWSEPQCAAILADFDRRRANGRGQR